MDGVCLYELCHDRQKKVYIVCIQKCVLIFFLVCGWDRDWNCSLFFFNEFPSFALGVRVRGIRNLDAESICLAMLLLLLVWKSQGKRGLGTVAANVCACVHTY